MLELYIIRHGLAGKSLTEQDLDEARPLSKKGQKKMKKIAKGLKNLKIQFDEILSSPLPRSKETADILTMYCGDRKQVAVTDLLKPNSSYNALVKLLNTYRAHKNIAIVGHEPFLSSFVSYCLTKNTPPLIYLKKGGILKLEIDEVVKPGGCKLSWLMEPAQIIQKKSAN